AGLRGVLAGFRGVLAEPLALAVALSQSDADADTEPAPGQWWWLVTFDRSGRPELRDEPAGQALRLGWRRAQRLRLLRADDARLSECRGQPNPNHPSQLCCGLARSGGAYATRLL